MSAREKLRAFATWRGTVRFLAAAEATRVYAQVKCGDDRAWWHSVSGVDRKQLERAAGAGLGVLFRAPASCAWNGRERHQLLLCPTSVRELLVALDAALAQGLPVRGRLLDLAARESPAPE